MIPEFGHFALIVALLVALVLGTLPLVGAQRGNVAWMALARPAALTLFGLTLVSFLCLAWAFYANDFSVGYVANNSNTKLPLFFRLGAVWGGHEGSLLLWILILTGWMALIHFFSRSLDTRTTALVLAVLGLVVSGMLLFVLFTSNPFLRQLPASQEGNDLNPLLQDPGLVFHPPTLYMGYVGFSVAFAFAIAALISGRLDAAWARWSRPWTLAAWIFLTLGIAMGSRWAYYVLGWGGWWFWDPVENASLIPWLVGTALIHSLAVSEKRNSFKSWTVLLAIAAFSLSLLGTFLVRSGVLTSVHAFANDPRRGIFILVLLATVVGASLLLYAWRAPRVGLGGSFALVSREALLLVNNVILTVACAAVLLGTLYPLILDALNQGKISVGPPYFDAVFVPLMLPLVLLAAVGSLLNWKRHPWRRLLPRLLWPLLAALLVAVLAPLLMGRWSWLAALSLGLATWLVASVVEQIIRRLRQPGKPAGWFWGMHLAHLGLAVFVIGVTMVNTYQQERDVRMSAGDTVSVGGHEFKLLEVKAVQGPNYSAQEGEFVLSQHGREISRLRPQKRVFEASGMPLTDAAIDSGFSADLYVSLGEALPDGAWAVRVYYKPFVGWVWGGCFLMALGGMVAALDKRYRLPRQRNARIEITPQAAPQPI